MTEDDILYLEKQIQNLQVMHKVQKVETELEQLEHELQELLPVSAALAKEHFTVNPKRLQGKEDDLPAWCSKISILLKSMAILLATLGGKAVRVADMVTPDSLEKTGQAGEAPEATAPPAPTKVGPIGIARSQSFSCTREEIEKEISQCGVSVKNLKANYELHLRSQQSATDPSARVYKRKRSLPVGTAQFTFGREPILEEDYISGLEPFGSLVEGGLPTIPHSPLLYGEEGALFPGQEEVQCEEEGEPSSGEASFSPDHLTRSLPVQTELSCIQDYIDMRKERIVYLFMEHWKKWTFTESVRQAGPRKRSVEAPTDSNSNQDREAYDGPAGKEPSEDDRLLYFMKQRQVVGKLIAHWRSIISQVPTRQIRRLSRGNMLYWPEQFLPRISGTPVAYDSLTLDLFMLGYFQLLEMSMSREERKFRHLLCYEMFDRLGSHSWELIRRFHRVVMEEIEAGKRDWLDGFEDLKQDFFGDSLLQAETEATLEVPGEPPGSSPILSRQESSQTLVSVSIREPSPLPPAEEEEEERATNPAPKSRKGSVQLVSELGEFSNEDICCYIDRSFSFWKEKEAEMFDI
ncbi:espin-like protein [Sceloporus undulatus]|uniref:espin-like protein n=1 Tax=Sceloporus undulatus TaxID=8520 RepID=UPI001C4CA2CE|nr:espin-like protein [Sceloporus undulatus]